MKKSLKSFLAILIACVTVLGCTCIAFAGDSVKCGLNEGGLWYSGYKGAYCHYYSDSGLHYARAKVKSNGSWVVSYTSKASGQWAIADTGLQPNVTDWDAAYGII